MNKLNRIVVLIGKMIEAIITILLLLPLMGFTFIIFYIYHLIKNYFYENNSKYKSRS